MCGRFTLKTLPTAWADILQQLLDFSPSSFSQKFPDWQPRYNIAPTQSILAVSSEAQQNVQMNLFRWGLIPGWADQLSVGSNMINARRETIDEKRSFRGPLANRRCVVLADGYYEWQVQGKHKQPYWITLPDEQIFLFAGLWDTNRKATGDLLQSCTIITTAANDSIRLVHDRMPILLSGDEANHWLTETSTDVCLEILDEAATKELSYFPVSKQVNSPRIDEPQCIEPLPTS